MVLFVIFLPSHPELSVQRVSVTKRFGDTLPDELRAVRPEHGQRPVFPAIGRIPRHTRHRLERRQFRTRKS